MTVKDIADYWKDREFLPDENQEVVFKMGDALLEVKGTTVSEKGPVSVEMAPTPTRKYMFSLKFEANPVIEATSVEEAEAKAFEMIRCAKVKKYDSGLYKDDPDYVAQEPEFLEEVKE